MNELYIFLILFNPFSTGKSKNSISEISIIPQTLNVNNKRTTSAKSINLDVVSKLNKNKNSLKNVSVKAMVILAIFEILLFEGRLLFLPANEIQRAKELNFQ